MGGVGNWDKFVLLMWKNWILMKRHWVQSTFEILIPIAICGALGKIQSILPNKDANARQFRPSPIDSYVKFDLNNQLYYYPKTDQITAIMESVIEMMSLNGTKGFEDESQLLGELKDNQPLAGVVFKQGTNETLDFKIKFPSELRQDEGTWETDKIFRPIDDVNNRMGDKSLPPRYDDEGFIAVQSAVSIIFLKYWKVDINHKIQLQRYSIPKSKETMLEQGITLLLVLTVTISFSFVFLHTVKVLVTEKESQLKEMMKIMGLQNWLHWTAWFVKSSIVMIVSMSLITIFWKMEWDSDTKNAILIHSDPTAVWLFLFVYSISTVTYSFFIGSIFSKSSRASLLGSLLWFATIVPYLTVESKMRSQSIVVLLILCLGNNSAMGFGIKIIRLLENKSDGLQWSNFFTPTKLNESLSVGYITVMLALDSVLFTLLALYLEKVIPGEFGVPEKWYFPIEGLIPRRKGSDADFIHSANHGIHFEHPPHDKTAGVKIKGLRKVFRNKIVAVQDLTLNMYNGEITVLLGNNGAGKTTVMSMLTGMIPPTAGTALVNGHDIRTNLSEVRESIGLCTQHNILFDDLSVREHIVFYSSLKGLSPVAAETEARKYASQLELTPQLNKESKTLSGGMKRKLCMAIAFCGKTKVIFCDEPTSGMDPVARRALWDLLQKEKKGRTILLSTHFMDEADILGDRIAIMHTGELKCYGTALFLKNSYGSGYELICEKSAHCDVHATTHLIQQYIPNIKVHSNIGSELTYKLDEKYSYILEDLLGQLENKMHGLGILGFGIALTTLEDVFLKVSYENLNTEESSKHSLGCFGTICKYTILTGGGLFWNQIKAMVYKKALFTWRNIFITVAHMLIPLLIVILCLTTHTSTSSAEMPALPIVLDDYKTNPLALISPTTNELIKTYGDILTKAQVLWELKSVDSVNDHILNMTENEYEAFTARSWISLSEHNKTITAWFNEEGYHTQPLTLNTLFTALLKTKCPTCSISVTNSPFPYVNETRKSIMESKGSPNVSLIMSIPMAFIMVTCFFILFYIKENTIRFKLLQFVSGINVWVFWITSFVWDYMIFTTSVLMMFGALFFFQAEGWSSELDLIRLSVLFASFIWGILPFIYLFAALFETPSEGYNKVLLVGNVSGFMPVIVLFILEIRGDTTHISHVLCMLPYYALLNGLINILKQNRFAKCIRWPMIRPFFVPKIIEIRLIHSEILTKIYSKTPVVKG